VIYLFSDGDGWKKCLKYYKKPYGMYRRQRDTTYNGTSGITDTKRFLDRFTQVIAKEFAHFKTSFCACIFNSSLEFSSMLFDCMK
jgi:hypothetical protein